MTSEKSCEYVENTKETKLAGEKTAFDDGKYGNNKKYNLIFPECRIEYFNEQQSRAKFVHHIFLSHEHLFYLPHAANFAQCQRGSHQRVAKPLQRGFSRLVCRFCRARLGFARFQHRKSPFNLQFFHQLCLLLFGRQDFQTTHVQVFVQMCGCGH